MSKINLHDVITEDFNTMRGMISDIEVKLMGVDPAKQLVFIKALKTVIYEAWADAKNTDDSFLFKS